MAAITANATVWTVLLLWLASIEHALQSLQIPGLQSFMRAFVTVFPFLSKKRNRFFAVICKQHMHPWTVLVLMLVLVITKMMATFGGFCQLSGRMIESFLFFVSPVNPQLVWIQLMEIVKGYEQFSTAPMADPSIASSLLVKSEGSFSGQPKGLPVEVKLRESTLLAISLAPRKDSGALALSSHQPAASPADCKIVKAYEQLSTTIIADPTTGSSLLVKTEGTFSGQPETLPAEIKQRQSAPLPISVAPKKGSAALALSSHQPAASPADCKRALALEVPSKTTTLSDGINSPKPTCSRGVGSMAEVGTTTSKPTNAPKVVTTSDMAEVFLALKGRSRAQVQPMTPQGNSDSLFPTLPPRQALPKKKNARRSRAI